MTNLNLTAILPKSDNSQTLPSLFISHGAPTIAIEDTIFTQALQQLGKTLPKPKLIIAMSAHWESNELLINANPTPDTWHDFGGFPRALFEMQYPAKGYPEVAITLAQQLQSQGVAIKVTDSQPFDHGVWTPLVHLYPHADVPIVQVSLPHHFNAKDCYELGKLFAPLRQEQVLIMASGSITHHLGHVRFNSTEIEPEASQFKYAMIEQLKNGSDSVLGWQSHPLATYNHPTPEHLLPLFFAKGAGETGTGGRVGVVHESFAHYSLGMDIYRFD